MPIQKFFLQDASTGRTSKIFAGITALAQSIEFSRIQVAVAYATVSGCRELTNAFSNIGAWEHVEKQWLISVDFGITEPEALKFIDKLPRSTVRIPDGAELLKRKLKPRQSFHTKIYIFDNENHQGLGIFAGSANLTFSGLHLNAENGISTLWETPVKSAEKHSLKSVLEALGWWIDHWEKATPVDQDFLKAYKRLRRPKAPNEDATDIVKMFADVQEPEVATQCGLAWATARYFWIETYELYKNLGNSNPGNQLDCVRGTRTYFGFSPKRVPKNTVIGKVNVQYQNKTEQLRSVRYADNQMDKVNLPKPGQDGPPSYDNTFILFERVGNQRFSIKLAKGKDHAIWRKKSNDQGLYFKFAGGREYGFFS